MEILRYVSWGIYIYFFKGTWTCQWVYVSFMLQGFAFILPTTVASPCVWCSGKCFCSIKPIHRPFGNEIVLNTCATVDQLLRTWLHGSLQWAFPCMALWTSHWQTPQNDRNMQKSSYIYTPKEFKSFVPAETKNMNETQQCWGSMIQQVLPTTTVATTHSHSGESTTYPQCHNLRTRVPKSNFHTVVKKTSCETTSDVWRIGEVTCYIIDCFTGFPPLVESCDFRSLRTHPF